MKRILFNATHPEELRVAIVDGQTLVDLDIENLDNENKRGNIYKGIVTTVEPSLEAVFVDYGSDRQGFLSLRDISRNYFSKDYSASTPMAQVKVQDVIKPGDALVVQVEKNERGNKGAALTTFISLAGRFLVLLPHNPRGGGISRQIDGSERSDLKEIMSQLTLPTEHAIIARTAGIGQNVESFKADLNYLTSLWKNIEATANNSAKPFLIYEESSLMVRTLRDYLRDDVREILIDDEELYENTKNFLKDVMPSTKVEVLHYTDPVPLFSKFQVEQQIENAFERQVRLPTGGVIVIEQTEALVTIDVNSARSTSGADIEETALETNLEAVEAIAKQLKVRDIGGLIVIDLIDMGSSKSRKSVERKFAEALESDRARTRIGKVSQFGLLEMSRQRLRSSIEETNHERCPRCRGRGFIRSVTSSALSILRVIEGDALKENTELIHAHLPIDVATFLVNEKRYEISAIERRSGTRIVIIPSRSILTPDSEIIRFTAADIDKRDNDLSYTLKSPDKQMEIYNFPRASSATQSAAIKQDLLLSQSTTSKSSSESKLKRIVKTIFGDSNSKNESDSVTEDTPKQLPQKQTRSRRRSSRKATETSQTRSSRRPSRGNTERSNKKQSSSTKRGSQSPRKKPSKPSGNSIHYPDPNRADQVDGNVNSVGSLKSTSSRSRRPSRPRSRPRSERNATDKIAP